MLFFQTVLSNFELLGIGRNQNLFRRKFIVNLIVHGLLSMWATMSLLCSVSDVNDYMEYIFMITGNILFVILFAIIHLKQNKFFELIDSCEGIVERSK